VKGFAPRRDQSLSKQLERLKFMIFIILYALAVLTFVFWVLGWSLWHSYLAFSRFFRAHNHKRHI